MPGARRQAPGAGRASRVALDYALQADAQLLGMAVAAKI
jgi:hypothetical protein